MLKNYLKTLKQSGINRNIPNITEENAKYIGKMLAEKNPKHILEIGTANGYSALSFLYWINFFSKNTQNTPLPDICTIEYAWNAHNEAVEHFKNCKIKNIFPIWGDAKKVIPNLQDDFFDAIYIDAMKKEYLDYLLLCLPKLKKNGIIIIDDVEKFAHKMKNLYDYLRDHDIKYTLHKTDEDDSIMTLEYQDLIHTLSICKNTEGKEPHI